MQTLVEFEKKIDWALCYCPICKKVHSMDVIKLVVYTKLGDIPVKYTEIFDRCEESNYQRVRDRNLTPFIEMSDSL